MSQRAVSLGKLAAYKPGPSSRSQVAPARYSEQAVEGAYHPFSTRRLASLQDSTSRIVFKS